MKEKDIELIKEMKEFFKLNSIEAIAKALGYSKASANHWHNFGITKPAKDRYYLLKAKKNEMNVKGNHNITISGNYNNINKSVDYEIAELLYLIENYATPKMIKDFKEKLLKIKELHNED